MVIGTFLFQGSGRIFNLDNVRLILTYSVLLPVSGYNPHFSAGVAVVLAQ